MLSAWCRPGHWPITNDEVAAHVVAFPDRFAGVAAVDLANPVAAVRELDRTVRQLGFKAPRVLPWLWICRRTTSSITRFTSNASSGTSRSAHKSDTRAR